MEKVIIYRVHRDFKQNLGVLVHDRNADVFVCKTLELAWKDNARNISCIPADEYTVKWTYSPKFKRMMYLVMSVPNRDGIRMHPATYYKDLQGCIALGSAFKNIDMDSQLDIIHSGDTVKAFEERMNGKTFKLRIVDPVEFTKEVNQIDPILKFGTL